MLLWGPQGSARILALGCSTGPRTATGVPQPLLSDNGVIGSLVSQRLLQCTTVHSDIPDNLGCSYLRAELISLCNAILQKHFAE